MDGRLHNTEVMTSPSHLIVGMAIFLLSLTPALAQTEEDDTGILLRSWSILQEKRDELSQQLVDVSDAIDVFFGDDRILEEANRTRVQATLETDILDETPSAILRTRVKLHLPRISRRFNLILANDDQLDEDDPDATLLEQNEPRDFSTSLQVIVRKDEKWNIRGALGMRFNNGLDPLANITARRNFTGENWLFRLSERLFWYRSESYGETTRLDIETEFDENALLRFSSDATWRRIDGFFELKQSVSTLRRLTRSWGIVHAYIISGETEPTVHIVNHRALVRLRKRAFRHWLFFEIEPQMNWPQEENFAPTPAFFLRMEIMFGGRETKKKKS